MVRKLFNVFGDDEVHSVGDAILVPYFKDLHIVAQNIWGHLVWRDVDDFNVRVFGGKNPAQLSIFSLQKLLHRDAFHFIYAKRVNVNFNPLPTLDCRPSISELLHHLLPNKQGLIRDLFNPIFCLFLELIEAETPLNDSCFCHQELKISVGNFRFMHSPAFLDDSCRQDWAFKAFEHQTWNFNFACDLILVNDTGKELFFCELL